jgi:hypothetical protein
METLGRQSDLARIVGQIAPGIRAMLQSAARTLSSAILAEQILGTLS